MSRKKPEDLIAYLMKIFTAERDIVIDVFAGSGTTAAVAMKLNRQFITVEQMDYAETLTKRRLLGVISGEENDVLPEEGYQGGGSFVYCELSKLNQKYVEDIQTAATDADIASIWDDMAKTGFISCKVNPSEIDMNADEFTELSLDDKKRFLMELLDKNQLYVNYCDMEDETFAVSDADKAFTKSFYGEM